MKNRDITKIKSIHFIGIKGVAMAALAIIAKEMGISVSGSDTEEKFPTDITLGHFGIIPKLGFSPTNIPSQTELVIYTGAHHGAKNQEVVEAIRRGIAVLPHGKALGLFMKAKRGLAVAGSHGKTTTSALIASVLMTAGKDPSFAVGCGAITNLQTPAHAGKGEWFVAEADEYVTDPEHDKTPRFLWQHPEVLLITNIDFDHPDVYESVNQVQDAFVALTEQMSQSGTVIVNVDDPYSAEILPRIKRTVVSFGSVEGADFQVSDIKSKNGTTHFQVTNCGTKLGTFTLQIPGVHNALNATGAVAALLLTGLSVQEIKAGFGAFTGTKRRFEQITEKNNKLLIDDYAHHPAEIAATLAATRGWYPHRRLIAIFQPHTYSRTRVLLNGFALSLAAADIPIITEIYASAREIVSNDISGEVLAEQVKKHQPKAVFLSNKEAVLQYIEANSQPNDLILTIGAGDIYTWIPEIEKVL